ncbi:MAG: ribonuclease P protein component [Flavobacteriales bacterium]|nr:ribonuclease P protein component [Flavobacteriales bacterium]
MKRRVVMDRVFSEGHTAKGFPLIARFALTPPDGPAPSRVAFTVSKRRFKRAVDRNKIKRLMREAWRQHRAAFEAEIPAGHQCAVVLIFVGKDLPTLSNMERGMVKLLNRMAQAGAATEQG